MSDRVNIAISLLPYVEYALHALIELDEGTVRARGKSLEGIAAYIASAETLCAPERPHAPKRAVEITEMIRARILNGAVAEYLRTTQRAVPAYLSDILVAGKTADNDKDRERAVVWFVDAYYEHGPDWRTPWLPGAPDGAAECLALHAAGMLLLFVSFCSHNTMFAREKIACDLGVFSRNFVCLQMTSCMSALFLVVLRMFGAWVPYQTSDVFSGGRTPVSFYVVLDAVRARPALTAVAAYAMAGRHIRTEAEYDKHMIRNLRDAHYAATAKNRTDGRTTTAAAEKNIAIVLFQHFACGICPPSTGSWIAPEGECDRGVSNDIVRLFAIWSRVTGGARAVAPCVWNPLVALDVKRDTAARAAAAMDSVLS